MEGLRNLREDKDFFEEYQRKFEEKLNKDLLEVKADEKFANLKRIVEILFDGIFNFGNRKFKEKLAELIYDLHKANIPIRKFLSEIFLDLLKEYINYLKSKPRNGLEIKKVQTLSNTLDKYLDLVDQVFVKYLNELEKEKKEEEFKPDDARKILEALKNSHTSTVELLAFYKVFPVLCRTSIYKITDLFTKTAKCPYKVFSPDERVYIKIPKLQKDAIGEIVNVESDYMIIKPLKFADIPPSRSVKVFPKKETDVEIKTPQGTVYGFMHYITFDEIGVIVPSAEGLRENQRVEIKFQLPTGEVKAKGTVKGIKKLDSSYIVSIEMELDPRMEQIVSRYVLKRQQEILKEIKL